ncbi:helix-turn-helix domain-containing protein [Oceanobacillus profundus]|uniref:XRE family transcriptional regulator n=1 Tax=Oceanobacillus profundus TaxID=372463 RepID=A0A417YJR1_9BACI|nr:helix-turn-helix transcriptional regulator [Oceanobacillus profundus]RHW33554.1 XRE family transcriptional regulator [Oceanobacillus profundus]
MNTGDRIKKLRKEMRLTQVELGSKINSSAQVISNWERGYTSLSHDDVVRLAKALNTKTDYLLGYSEESGLTEKDEKDIAKRMKKIKKDLIEGNADGEGLNFMGEPMSEEAIESLLEALEHAERIATLANKKYTPKKFRDKE